MANKKKNNKKGRKKKNNKNIIKVVLPIIILVILLVIILLVIFSGNKKIECTKKINNNGINLGNEIIVKMRDNNIKNIIVNKTITLDKKNSEIDYLSAIKSSLEDTYKKIGITYSIKEQEGKLIVNLTYNKKKEYILDNIFINFENNGLSINVISEDRENNYSKLDLSKKYEYKNVIKILEKSDYKCK